MYNKKIKLIFFDLGSVLIHVNIEKFFAAFARHAGISLDAVKQKSVLMKSVVMEFNCGRLKPVDFYKTVCNGFNNFSFEQFAGIYTNIFSLNEEIASIVTTLEKDVRLSIISNTDEMHYGYIVDHFPVMSIFEKPVTSFQAHAVKPGKEIFHYALDELKVSPEDCIFIDDIHENVAAANDLGINALHYTETEKLKNELKIYGFYL